MDPSALVYREGGAAELLKAVAYAAIGDESPSSSSAEDCEDALHYSSSDADAGAGERRAGGAGTPSSPASAKPGHHFHGSSSPRQLGSGAAKKGGAPPPGMPAPWVVPLLQSCYFGPCERHRHHKKNECTFFCATCGVRPHSVCQHCMGHHAGHHVVQIRRYVYCDVIRVGDISPYVDTTGVQTYIINQAKVMFLNHRPQAKVGRPGSADVCHSCHRHLREGCAYCSLACKVEALYRDDAPAGAPPSFLAEAVHTAHQPQQQQQQQQGQQQQHHHHHHHHQGHQHSQQQQQQQRPLACHSSEQESSEPYDDVYCNHSGGDSEDDDEADIQLSPPPKRARLLCSSSLPAGLAMYGQDPAMVRQLSGHSSEDGYSPQPPNVVLSMRFSAPGNNMRKACSRRKQNTPQRSPTV